MQSMEWVLLGISVALVLACGLFAAAEYSFVTVDRSAVDSAAAQGNGHAKGVQSALRSLSTQLSGAQVGITLTNLVIGFLAEPAIASLMRTPLTAVGLPSGAVPGASLAIGLVLATLATMLFGELLPKRLALALPLQVACATQRFMRVFTSLTLVLIRVLNGSANAIVRAVGVEPQEELRSARSTKELASLAHRSATEGKLDSETAHLVERSVAFGPRTAGEIMTPRLRVTTISAADCASAVLAHTSETGFSKFPVIGSGIDDVIGSIHLKQVLALPRADRDRTTVNDIMAAPMVVPESLRLDPLLTLLRESGYQIAVVSDEYGGTAGMVTLEDVVEEIVGDITDEHDRHGARLRQRLDGSWILSGLLRPDEIAEATDIALPEDDGYDTVAGLLVKALGRIPKAGDQVEVLVPLLDSGDDEHEPASALVRLRVERMDGLRVDRLSMRELPAAGDHT